jgi:hypothetical protein
VIFELLSSLVGTYGGRHCRVCGEPIDRHDGFAMSEAVCRSCGA